MLENFFNFQEAMKSHQIQMMYPKFDSTISSFSYYFVDQDNRFISDTNQLKYQTQIIIVDKYDVMHQKEKRSYLILSFLQNVIIVEPNNLSLVQQIFTCNDNSSIYFLNGAKECFQDQNQNVFKESEDDTSLFQSEIDNFKQKFDIKKSRDNSPCFYKIWNMIKSSIAGYLIKKSYSKVKNRLTNFFKGINEENREIQEMKFTELDYVTLRNLGHGSSGFVDLIYSIEKGELFALKTFYTEIESNHQNREKNCELNKHPLISKRYGTVGNQAVIIEYFNGVELKQIKKLSTKEKIKIIFEIMIIVEYLHNHHYIYRDLKPDNLIIDDNKTTFLVDFDRLVKLDEAINNPNFTKDFASIYFAPEIAQGQPSYANDIYSIGILIYYILTVEIRNKPKSEFKFDLKEFSNIPDEFSKMKEICKRCTNEKPEERPTISKLINEFCMKIYFPNNEEDKSIKKRDIETVAYCKDIHEIKYSYYWISLAEYDNHFCQLYKESIDFYTKIVPYFLRQKENSISSSQKTKQYDFSFEQLPRHYEIDINHISNKIIRQVYSKFTFLYINIQKKRINQSDFEVFLIDYLKDFNFFAYKIINSQYNQENMTLIICIEGKCIILECIKPFEIEKILNKKDSISINTDSESTEIKDEIQNYCGQFQNENQKNKFVALTIQPIACYMIRRFFCPSHFFNDPAFFFFGSQNIEEQKSKNALYKLMKKRKEEEYFYNYSVMAEEINNSIKTNEEFLEFNLKDFVILRQLKSSYLVIHLASHYIFMMKKIDLNENFDEIYKNKLFSHRTLIPFYGFVKENGKTVGLIFEFMSNGPLETYIKSGKGQICPFYLLMTIARIFSCIEFYYNESLDHISLSTSDIFVNHDGIVYIKKYGKFLLQLSNDLKSEKQNNSSNSIIYSYSKIIHYLLKNCEKKNLKINDDDFSIQNIKNLHEYCTKNNLDDGFIYNDIKNIIIREMESFDYFEHSLIKERNKLWIFLKIQFLYEYFLISKKNSLEAKKFLYKICIFIILYLKKKKRMIYHSI